MIAALVGTFLTGHAAAASAQTCTAAPLGVVAWLPGDGHSSDITFGKSAAAVSPAFAPGRVARGFSFDGVSDPAIPLNGSPFGTNDFAVEFWIQTSSGREESVMGNRPFCDDTGVTSLNETAGADFAAWWEIRVNAVIRFEVVRVDKICLPGMNGSFNCHSTRARGQVSTTKVVADGQLHHIAAVRHGSVLDLYVDGVLDATNDTTTIATFDAGGGATGASITHDIVNITSSLFHQGTQTIGGGGGSSCTAPFTGTLDEVTMYNRALAASDAQAIAGAGSAGKCKNLGWGYGYQGRLASPIPPPSLSPPRPLSIGPASGGAGYAFTAMAGGFDHSLGLRPDGTVLAWGVNSQGQLGSGVTGGEYWTPLPVVDALQTPLTGVTAIAASFGTSYALRSDGTLWVWGDTVGLGGPPANTPFARPVPGLVGVTAVAAMSQGGVALRCDGTVVAWGNNAGGALWNGGSNPQIPVEIAGINRVVAITAGSSHVVALRDDGTVWTWGPNANQTGELGYDVAASPGVPQQVPGVDHVIAVSANAIGFFTLALKSDGTVLAWGQNDGYQLGDGTTTNRSAPAPVSGLPRVKAIAATVHTSFAVTMDGTVMGWGGNGNGEMGFALVSPYAYPSPTVITGGVSAITAGSYHVFALSSVPSSVVAASVCAVCTAVPATGLAAWYAANDDARDSAGGQHDATLHNGVLFGPGRAGRGFTFSSGGHAYVELPASLFPFPTSGEAHPSYSVDAWFATTGSGPILAQQNGPVEPANFNGSVPAIYVGTDGRLYAQMFWTGGAPMRTRGVVADGSFHHVALTYDGTTQRLYLDGLAIDSQQVAQYGYGASYSYTVGYGYTGTTIINNTWAFWEATPPNGGFQSFDGVIDEVHVFDTAIGAGEVASLYLAGPGGYCVTPIATTPTITWNTPADITEGTLLDATQLNATASVPGSFAYQPPAGTRLDPGSHPLAVTFTPDDGVHFTTAWASVDIMVVAAPSVTPLTITVSAATKPYSAVLPAFSVNYSGFRPGDGPQSLTGVLTFTTAATAASDVGTYDVTPGGLSSPNYAITFLPGVLTVTRAASTLSMIANPRTVTAGLPVTITATVAAPLGPPSGTVQFSEGVTPLGAARPLAGGSATLATTLGPGTHVIDATYAGSLNVAGSSGSVAIVVHSAPVAQQLTDAIVQATRFGFKQGVALLQNALASIGKSGPAACNQINAFTNQLKAQAGKQLTDAQAAALAASAATIRAALECPGDVARVIRYSTDITVALGSITATDQYVVEEDTGTGAITPLLRLPANVDGYQLGDNGRHLLSFDVTTTLGGVTVGPADVVAWDGTTAAIVFDARARGIPNGVNVDAIGLAGGNLLLSFDTTVALTPTLITGPRDVVRVTPGGFERYFDGAAAGVPAGLRITSANVDAAHDTLLFTFDGAATIAGVYVTKADIVAYDRTAHTWRPVWDGEARHAGLQAANIDALWVPSLAAVSPVATTTSIH